MRVIAWQDLNSIILINKDRILPQPLNGFFTEIKEVLYGRFYFYYKHRENFVVPASYNPAYPKNPLKPRFRPSFL